MNIPKNLIARTNTELYKLKIEKKNQAKENEMN